MFMFSITTTSSLVVTKASFLLVVKRMKHQFKNSYNLINLKWHLINWKHIFENGAINRFCVFGSWIIF